MNQFVMLTYQPLQPLPLGRTAVDWVVRVNKCVGGLVCGVVVVPEPAGQHRAGAETGGLAGGLLPLNLWELQVASVHHFSRTNNLMS